MLQGNVFSLTPRIRELLGLVYYFVKSETVLFCLEDFLSC